MPIYEYQCQKCGKEFEYQQSMKDPPKKKCEKCGGKLERLISQSAFVLKGGGWYKDLYSKKPGGSSSSEAKSESKPEASDSKSEPKPETKSESKAPSGDKKSKRAAKD